MIKCRYSAPGWFNGECGRVAAWVATYPGTEGQTIETARCELHRNDYERGQHPADFKWKRAEEASS